MSGEDKQRDILRRYLLGELPEAERSRLAEQYFIDEELFDELLDVENELLDQYMQGELSPEERKSFGDYLTALPDGAGKLATAHVLMEAASKARETSPSSLSESPEAPLTEVRTPFADAVPVPLSRWGRLRESLLGERPFLRYAVASLLIALIAGLAYLIVSQRQLRRDVEQLRAERTRDEQEKANLTREAQSQQQDQASLRDRNRQLEQELAQVKQQQEQQQTETNRAVLASLVLTPALRSGSTTESLTISNATKTLSLVMPIPKDEQITNYNAVLRTTGGQIVLTKERLQPQLSQQGRTVTLRLPAAQLSPNNYKLTLQGKGADGVEIAHDFYFSIARRQ